MKLPSPTRGQVWSLAILAAVTIVAILAAPELVVRVIEAVL